MKPNEIKDLRLALGMNQTAFASELGVSQATVSRWESGVDMPSLVAKKLLKILSQKLGC